MVVVKKKKTREKYNTHNDKMNRLYIHTHTHTPLAHYIYFFFLV